MVFEQMFTILFATGIGVAVVLYSARPRHRASAAMVQSSLDVAPAEVQAAAPMPEVAATASPVVEATADVQPITEIAPVSAEVAATGTIEAGPISAVGVAAAASSTVDAAVESPSHSAGRAHRAPKRRSAASKARAKPSSKARKR